MAWWSPGPCPPPKGPESCSWLSPVVAGAPLYMGRAVGRGPCYPAHPSKCLGMAPYRGGPGPHHLAQMVTIAVLPTTGGSQSPTSWLDLTASRVLPTNEGFLGLSTHVNQAATGAVPLTKWVREPPPHFNPGTARAPPTVIEDRATNSSVQRSLEPHPHLGAQGPLTLPPPTRFRSPPPSFLGSCHGPTLHWEGPGPCFLAQPNCCEVLGHLLSAWPGSHKIPTVHQGAQASPPHLALAASEALLSTGEVRAPPPILAWQLLRSCTPLGAQGPCPLAWTSDHHVPTSSQGLQPIPSLSQSQLCPHTCQRGPRPWALAQLCYCRNPILPRILGLCTLAQPGNCHGFAPEALGSHPKYQHSGHWGFAPSQVTQGPDPGLARWLHRYHPLPGRAKPRSPGSSPQLLGPHLLSGYMGPCSQLSPAAVEDSPHTQWAQDPAPDWHDGRRDTTPYW